MYMEGSAFSQRGNRRMKDCCVCVSVCRMHARILFRCDIYLKVVSLKVSAYMDVCSSHSGNRTAPKLPVGPPAPTPAGPGYDAPHLRHPLAGHDTVYFEGLESELPDPPRRYRWTPYLAGFLLVQDAPRDPRRRPAKAPEATGWATGTTTTSIGNNSEATGG